MIRAQNLTLRRGTKVLLDNASFTIHAGECIGVVGKNGAGKSTLFSLLQGHIDVDAGQLDISPEWRIASVEQIITDQDRPAREFVMDGDHQLRTLQEARRTVSDTEGEQIAELEAQLIEAEAWSAPSRAEQLLAGLGFSADEWMRPVREFSGGWQMRIALARALMAPSDLLLLDEPTNHLDLDAMLWLERWIASYAGTVLIISHDSEFLEATAQHILHFDHCSLVRYRGSYQNFLTQRAERMRQSQLAWERQTREAARLQGFIDRFKAQASKAKQAQSRIKALARMETLTPLHAESGVDIRIPNPDSLPDPLLTLDNVDMGYRIQNTTVQNRIIFKGANVMIRSRDRIGILGVNGAGKSTLVKTLAGDLSALSGRRLPSKGLEVGYFAQQQLDMLDPKSTPLQHMLRIAPHAREQELRNYLGGFGFSGDSATSSVKPMSGGEKARLALALIVWRKPNLLLLDEPSNHLDVETREALAVALTDFEGSVLLVSHDRHLLRTTVDRFWIIANGQLIEFDGDLDDYRQWLSTHQAQAELPPDTHTESQSGIVSTDRRAERRAQAQERQRLSELRRPLEKQLRNVEVDMEACNSRLSELDAVIADPDFYSDARREERLHKLAEHGELSKKQNQLEEQWLTLQEKLESITVA